MGSSILCVRKANGQVAQFVKSFYTIQPNGVLSIFDMANAPVDDATKEYSPAGWLEVWRQ